MLRVVVSSILAVLILMLGGGAALVLIATKPVAAMATSFSAVRSVKVMPAVPQEISAPIVGFGNARPKNQVNILPEVSGKLIQANKKLAQGNVIPEGDLLFEIDDTVYKARVLQAKAEVRSLDAAMRRHRQEQRSLQSRMVIIKEMAAIDERNYLTSKKLFDVDHVGTSLALDVSHQQYLRQKDAVVVVQNRIDVIPFLVEETHAQLDAARARLDQAQHDLENTKIFCPFRARVESVVARESQVVTAHFSIATLTDLEAFEISVSVEPRDLPWLDRTIQPAALEETDVPQGPPVMITWSSPSKEITWQGRVTRFERMDASTRTARLVVEVRDLELKGTVGVGDNNRPPLSAGMYCRAELPAARLSGAILVPRHAIYDNGYVYVVEPQGDGSVGTLARRKVPLLRIIGDDVLVDHSDRNAKDVCELSPDELVVTSPLVSPVVGMKVAVRRDTLTDNDSIRNRSMIDRVRFVQANRHESRSH